MYETLPNYANNSQVSCHLEKKLLKLLQLQNCHSTSVVHKSLPTNSSVCGFVCRGPLYLLNDGVEEMGDGKSLDPTESLPNIYKDGEGNRRKSVSLKRAASVSEKLP
uniref:Uncharacterized protein n=1 Tax=Timema bartmani TaxID=61472 RepID=A0A7R9ERL0_9NEOP|nr:unnamed protein product [Timema bartmani]